MKSKAHQTTAKRSAHLRLAVTLTLALVGSLFLIHMWASRPYPVAKAAEDVMSALVENKPLPSGVEISNGSYGTLSAEQSRLLFSKVLGPSFKGWKLESVEQSVASADSAGASVLLVGPDGRRKLLLAGGPSPEGPSFSLDALLRLAWQLPVRDGTGRMPDWSLVAKASLTGLRRDRAVLEGAGISGLEYGHQGPMSWDELDAYFSRTITAPTTASGNP